MQVGAPQSWSWKILTTLLSTDFNVLYILSIAVRATNFVTITELVVVHSVLVGAVSAFVYHWVYFNHNTLLYEFA